MWRGLKTAYYHSLMHINDFLKDVDHGRVTIRFGVVPFARSVVSSAWTGQLLS